MAIGFSTPRGKGLAVCLLAAFGTMGAVFADDQIVLKSGSTVIGKITGIVNGQVAVSQAAGKTVLYLSDIQAVDMAPPAAVTQSKKAAPAEKISLLEPVLKVYAGLPADWVLDAMGDLADAYDAQGQGEKSAAVYAQINQLYPNSPYQKEALVGEAKTDLQAGKIDDALATIKPLIDQANQNIAPSPADGRLFASAFLVYGQALQQQKQYAQALEAFLTVKTMFYQSPALVDQADQLAQALQKQNPDVSVD
jgi:tetratricopeptide (TPR) repeat protein